MKTRPLGQSDLMVTDICLGTMTWGKQNSEAEGHAQLDYATGRGINFIDTAELYAIPPEPQTAGSTERFIGNWLSKNKGKREQLVIASKATGSGVDWVRDGEPLSGDAVKRAVEGSLKRLQTDYIDLYQLHWVNRSGPHFSRHWPGMIDYSKADKQRELAEHLDILTALDDCVKQGKIRYCGLSNDTPWGIQQYLQLAAEHDLPRMVSLQNEFSLLHLTDSPHILETCAFEGIAYLPWSPLAGGALSGKYRNGAKPVGSRWTIQQRNGLFRDTTLTHAAIDAYYEVAKRHSLSLAQLALAWVYQFPSVTSTIIGATSLAQLEENIRARELTLADEVIAEINAVIHRFPVPF